MGSFSLKKDQDHGERDVIVTYSSGQGPVEIRICPTAAGNDDGFVFVLSRHGAQTLVDRLCAFWEQET